MEVHFRWRTNVGHHGDGGRSAVLHLPTQCQQQDRRVHLCRRCSDRHHCQTDQSDAFSAVVRPRLHHQLVWIWSEQWVMWNMYSLPVWYWKQREESTLSMAVHVVIMIITRATTTTETIKMIIISSTMKTCLDTMTMMIIRTSKITVTIKMLIEILKLI